MAKHRATPVTNAEYVPSGLPDTAEPTVGHQNSTQSQAPDGLTSGVESPGNSSLPDASLTAGTEQVGPARGTVLIELPPLVELTEREREGYLADHVEARLKGAERLALKRLLISLKACKARLHGDREPLVLNGADAIRWLLQQIAAGTAADIVPD